MPSYDARESVVRLKEGFCYLRCEIVSGSFIDQSAIVVLRCEFEP